MAVWAPLSADRQAEGRWLIGGTHPTILRVCHFSLIRYNI
jgi:hypothetical protein